MTKQIKTKKRVAAHGEVFTNEREVNAMLDLVKNESERIESKFLEPACGDGNFLSEILRRKLESVKNKYRKNPDDYEIWSLIALTNIYGVELLTDNAISCRQRLFDIWKKEYKKYCKKEDKEIDKIAKYILEKNILNGNALSMMKVNDKQEDTEEPIIFTEWTFISQGYMLKRKEFRFDVLLKENENPENYSLQYSIFDTDASCIDYWEKDPDTGEQIPKPVKEYPPVYYRRMIEDVK